MSDLLPEDFSFFKSEADKWIKKFGLLDWRVDYVFEPLADNAAECRYSLPGRRVTIALNKSLPCLETCAFDISRLAFHEVCELLLADMESISLYETIPLEQRVDLTERARHAIIRRLENSIFYMKDANP